ncbi:hypothetical protein ACP4OV_027288 [Aristida adscensionis]
MPRHGCNSGVIALNCMRWFNGPNFCRPPNDGSRKP